MIWRTKSVRWFASYIATLDAWLWRKCWSHKNGRD